MAVRHEEAKGGGEGKPLKFTNAHLCTYFHCVQLSIETWTSYMDIWTFPFHSLCHCRQYRVVASPERILKICKTIMTRNKDKISFTRTMPAQPFRLSETLVLSAFVLVVPAFFFFFFVLVVVVVVPAAVASLSLLVPVVLTDAVVPAAV